MATLYTQQSSNVTKTWLLMGVFLVVVILLGWIASYWFGNANILYVAVAFALLMNIFSYWNSAKIALAVHGAHEADLHTYRELHNIVENLAITAGLPKPKVYLINDPVPNAFATGRDKEHAVIAVTSGLLNVLDRSELEGVIAHELAHIGNRDILLMTVVVVLVGFITLIGDFLIRGTLFGNRDNKIPPVLLLVGFIFIILSPLFSQILQLAISRKREFLADATGALLTRYPEGLANALRKISAHNVPMSRANHATSHMFIVTPFGPGKEKGKTSSFAKLFMTHPPLEERINALLGMNI